MSLPTVTLSPFSGSLSFEELAQSLLKEVIEADALMQVRQRVAWREALKTAVVLEGTDRLLNLGLTEARFSFRLDPVGTSWAARAWKVLTEPFGKGWFARVAWLWSTHPRRFRLASPRAEAGGLHVTLTMGRSADGHWQVHRQPEALPASLGV